MIRPIALKCASLFVFAFPIAAPALHAQSEEKLAVVKVPFQFEFGATHFEPGTYSLSTVGDNIMKIDSSTTSARVIARMDAGVTVTGTSKVVFHHVGGRYFLREVWQANRSTRVDNPETSAEARLRKARTVDIAVSQVPAPVTEVALRASLY